MNSIRKILLPIALLFACDKEDTDNAEPSGAEVESNAGSHGHRGRGGLKKLDTDGDGMISQAEARDSRLADRFAELDVDKDGKLGKDELHARKNGKGHDPAERAAHMLRKFDANNDGAVSRAEVGDHPKLAGKFAELDADSDGKLTSGELQALRGPGNGGGHGKGHGRWHDMDPAQRAAKMIEKFDADRDGSLSAGEIAEHPGLAGKFAEVDTNKDGKLSTAELTAFKTAHHGPGHRDGQG